MITIISGTNRPNSKSTLVSNHIQKMIIDSGADAQVLDLAILKGADFDHDYVGDSLSDTLKDIQAKYIFPVDKVIYVLAEYNGGVPGVLKHFIDTISVREYAQNFKDKKAFLVGLSAGRGGNSRGLEAFTGVLNYLGTHVYPTKLPLSTINAITDDHTITDEPTTKTLDDLLKLFAAY